jgi:hypothetical protein
VIVTTVFLGPDVGLIVVTVGEGSGVGVGVSSFLQDDISTMPHRHKRNVFFIQV